MTTAEAQQQSSANSKPGEQQQGAVEKPTRDITTLEHLNEVTSCGLTAQAVQSSVTAISVTHQGKQLGYWPPAVCQFTHVTSINLTGNSITFVPQAVQKLAGLKQLLLARNNLASLPPEISALTSLTELDVGGNHLRKLPDALCKLTNLKVLNAWGNQLTALPHDFGQLAGLVRLGLKGNQLTALPDSFCQLTNLVELFLTDNQLSTLPAGFGQLRSLVKLQASYNPFKALPDSLWHITSLELFRLAVGQLTHWEARLGNLPQLAWCSLGSNPAAAAVPPLRQLERVAPADPELVMGSKLGQGASGEVFEALWRGQRVAVKLFLSGASPDGSTREEIAITCSNTHPNLTEVLALVVGSDGPADGLAADQEVKGLIMKLVQGQPMADRPTSQHLLRCRWPSEHTYSSRQVLDICTGLASALSYLHSRGVCHGDVYAHNIMLEGSSRAVLCDFGAAFCYDTASPAAGFWEAMEARAFGLFMQGLLGQCRGWSEGQGAATAGGGAPDNVVQQLGVLMQQCLQQDPAARPRFAGLLQQLTALASCS